MPDILVLVFTANWQSIDGIKDVAMRAQLARQELAYDREQLLYFPLLSRFDSRAEFEESQKWLKNAADSLADYCDWLPESSQVYDLLERTKLPHIAHFSFGEKLPAVEQSITDPEGLSYAYQKTADLISKEFSKEVILDILIADDDEDFSLDADQIQFLRNELTLHPGLSALKLGNYNVTIGQASKIHIKDVADNSEMITGNKVGNQLIDKPILSQPLELLEVDSKEIEEINSNLKRIDFLEKKGYLNASQINAFTTLKQEAQSLNRQYRKLGKLYSATKYLLEESRINLKEKIEQLKSQSEKILDPNSLDQISPEKSHRENELEIIENFIRELDEAREIADWIDKARKALSKRFGREALKKFPEIEDKISPDQVSDFCFSIYQFLEQIAHCLKWGRYNILDSPGIPLVLSYPIYETAFSLIKEAIDKDLPARFTQSSRQLANECIGYLITQLPFYEQE